MRSGKSCFFVLGFGLILIGCKTSTPKPVDRTSVYHKSVKRSEGLRKLESRYRGKGSNDAEDILKDARKYIGAPYKYGGKSSSGVDCSGLMCMIFEENQLKLPRRSIDQSEEGKPIDITEVRPGDLLFFNTGSQNKVNHVGIVHAVNDDGEITFLHASTSKGVTISSLNEKYWNKAYVSARRVL